MNLGIVFTDYPDNVPFNDYVLGHVTQELDQDDFSPNQAIGLATRYPWSRENLEKPMAGFIHGFDHPDQVTEGLRGKFLFEVSQFAAACRCQEFALVARSWGIRGEREGVPYWEHVNVPSSEQGAVEIVTVHFLKAESQGMPSMPTDAWVIRMDKPRGPWEGYRLTDSNVSEEKPKEG